MRPSRKRIVSLFLLLAISLHGVANGEEAAARVRCKYTDGVAHLVGKVGEVTLNFAIDSGASHNVICTTALSKIGDFKTRDIPTIDNARFMDGVRIKSGNLSDNSGTPIVVMDLREVNEVTEFQLDGFLGMPFLRDKELEFSQDAIWIVEHRDNTASSIDTIECRKDRFGRLHVPMSSIVNSPELRAEALIDTGMNCHLKVKADLFAILVGRGIVTLQESDWANVEIDEDQPVFSLDPRGTLSLGAFRQTEAKTMDVGIALKNKIGLPLLTQCCVRIDFSSALMFLDASHEVRVTSASSNVAK